MRLLFGDRARTRASAVAAALCLVSLAVVPGASAQADTALSLNCSAYTLSVATADPGPADQSMWGQLCYRGPVEPATVQLLVAGATYNHTYWNFSYGDGYYSYVDAAALAGYATFNVDRIGTGNSSHPAGATLDVEAGAVALHDAIQDLRSGAVGGHAFSHVIFVGHSYGTLHAWDEISRYHDVDAAILTGALHGIDPEIVTATGSDFVEANTLPQFTGLDSGYETVATAADRESLYFDKATADPNVVAADFAGEDTVTTGQLSELPSTLDIGSPPSDAISQGDTVPTLLVDGEDDFLFCQNATVYNCAEPSTVLAYEQQYYPPQADLQLAIIPNTGHGLALSTTAPLTDATMLAWALAKVSPNA